VAVVAIDRGDQRGSNGTGGNVVVAISTYISGVAGVVVEFSGFFWQWRHINTCAKRQRGSGRVAVVPFDRQKQRGSNGSNWTSVVEILNKIHAVEEKEKKQALDEKNKN
jgi:hypothetical protein